MPFDFGFREGGTAVSVQQFPAKPQRGRRILRQVKRFKYLYLMLLLPLAQYVVFRYAPLTGLQVAFEDFNISNRSWPRRRSA